MKILKEILPYIIIIVAVILIRTFIITPVRVSGDSMYDTLKNGDILLLKKFDKSFERYDIVVFDKNDEQLIKRIIGLPGETIRYKNNLLYINDEIVEDIYAYGVTANFQEKTLGSDEYFVMGDNRASSLDSRVLGPIKYSDIDGKADFILYPFNKIGKLNK